MKIRGSESKRILRRVVERYVPPTLINRPKMGFAVPLDEWLRGPLKPWANELLDARRLKRDGYFSVAPIRTAWTDHLSRRASNGNRLWSILMFQSWLDSHRLSTG
jgi:asparagine synthase (glutamine-hydrolysing)